MSLKIRKKELICWVFLIVLWLPYTITTGNIMLSVLKRLSFFWACYLFVNEKTYQHRELYLLWAWIGWILLTTIINKTDLGACFTSVYPIFSTICILYFLITKYSKNAVSFTVIVYSFFAIVQFIQFLQKGTSFGRYVGEVSYFFGIRVNYNDFFVFSMASVFLAICLKIKKAHILSVIIIGLGSWFVIACKVSTAIMALLIFACVIVLSRFVRSKLVWYGVCTFIIVFCLLFVFGNVSPAKFTGVLVDFLGEDLTLNGRTVLWQQAFSQMKGIHWLIGNGYAHGYVFELNQFWSSTTAHSQYVNGLFCFGAIGIIIYILMLMKNISHIKKIEQKYWPVIIATNISMTFMGISTTFYASPYMYVWFVFCIAIEQGYFIRNEELWKNAKTELVCRKGREKM